MSFKKTQNASMIKKCIKKRQKNLRIVVLKKEH